VLDELWSKMKQGLYVSLSHDYIAEMTGKNRDQVTKAISAMIDDPRRTLLRRIQRGGRSGDGGGRVSTYQHKAEWELNYSGWVASTSQCVSTDTKRNDEKKAAASSQCVNHNTMRDNENRGNSSSQCVNGDGSMCQIPPIQCVSADTLPNDDVTVSNEGERNNSIGSVTVLDDSSPPSVVFSSVDCACDDFSGDDNHVPMAIPDGVSSCIECIRARPQKFNPDAFHKDYPEIDISDHARLCDDLGRLERYGNDISRYCLAPCEMSGQVF
jgi:hypothetical protein